ncbi:MAG: zinc-dependent peptidase [Candidatus Xenobiia bacterium LiM19]
MLENRIGDRAAYTGSTNYGVSTPDERKALREQRLEESLMAPVAAPGREEVQSLSRFYNKTLESVEQLRYPFQFPDIEKKGDSEALLASPQQSLNNTSSIGSVMPQYYNIASQMGRNIDANGREVPLSREQQTILAASLSKYDLSTLQNLQQEGLRIRLYDSENPPAGGYPGGQPEWDRNTLGLYRGNEKLLALRQKDFQRGLTSGVQDVVHHEVAHAVDDMLYPDSARGREMSTENDPYMRQLYSNYKNRTASNQGYQWSNYAKTNVKEYFADGVEFYMGGPEKRETLRQKDPELYAQVEQMLGRASGGRTSGGRPTPVWNRNTASYPTNYPINQGAGTYNANYTNYPASMNNGQYWGPRVNTTMWPDNRYQVMAQYMMLCRLQWMMAMMMTQSMGIPRF